MAASEETGSELIGPSSEGREGDGRVLIAGTSSTSSGSQLARGEILNYPFAFVRPDCVTRNLAVKEQEVSFPRRSEVVVLRGWWSSVEKDCTALVETLNRCSCCSLAWGQVTFFSPPLPHPQGSRPMPWRVGASLASSQPEPAQPKPSESQRPEGLTLGRLNHGKLLTLQ